MADRFTSLLDMIDGGGMGAEGNTFKGGGLLSDVANALFQPAGYRERQRGMAEARPKARPMSMGTQPPAPSAPSAPPQPTPIQPGPGMPGFNAPPQPMQAAPAMPSDPRTPSLPTRLQPGPGMPGFNAPPMQNNARPMANGQMPQETPAPSPMGMDPMMSQVESMLTPEQRQQLEMLPPDQRMGIMQRLMQAQGGM